MYFLNVCENPDILRIIYFGLKILDIVFIIVPIGLIVMVIIDVIKNIISSDDKTAKQSTKAIINRVIFAVLIFFVPTIVSAVMNLLSGIGDNNNYMACIDNANSEYINERIIEIAGERLATARQEFTMSSVSKAETAIAKIKDDNVREPLEQQVSNLKEEVRIAQKNDKEDDKQPAPGNGGSSNIENNEEDDKQSEHGNSGSSNFKNYGSGGIQGEYFAPIQNVTFNIGSFSKTDGCSNNSVSHDISGIAEGTPIYAGVNGTAKFYQKYCSSNNQLYSYGNMVKITASDGTYIIYAHLQKFPNNVISSQNANYITKSCPKKGSNAPCPASSCGGGMKENVVATLQVKKGDLIGYLGNTGNSTGPHLHIEIHKNGSSTCVTDPWKAFGMQ